MITKKSFTSLILLSFILLILNKTIHGVVEYEEYEYTTHKEVATSTKPPHATTSHPISGDIEQLKSTISLSLFDDSLRQGLQPFYVISNFLIDDVLKTSIPQSK